MICKHLQIELLYHALPIYYSPGTSIQHLTSVDATSHTNSQQFAEKTAMVRAARQLLSAVTKVLLLADKVIVKQLLISKNKVLVYIYIPHLTNSCDKSLCRCFLNLKTRYMY